jgi:tRNA(Ile)-lysidine synthase
MDIRRVEAFIAQHHLLDIRKKQLVALSGGADSVALLLILRKLGYKVEAVHCNFLLRGEESYRDEKFVKTLCDNLLIDLHLIHFETKTYAELHKVSIEMAARALRYGYFERLRQDVSAENVCVAHHQDDAVETLLMNLVRGTGIHGLTGIRPRNGRVVRPLLCVSHDEIVDFLREQHQAFVVDSSNLVSDVLRNKIRLEILPLLRSINPAVSGNIAKTARRMAEAERVFDVAVHQSLERLVHEGTISVDELLQEPSPEYLLQEWLTPLDFSPAQIEQIFGALDAPSGRIFLSATHELVIDRHQLVTKSKEEVPPTIDIPETGIYRYGKKRKIRVGYAESLFISRDLMMATLDADKVKFPLTIRGIRAGDRFQPFGMSGTKLVSDFLTDHKMNLLEKRRQLVVTDAEGQIVWLVGWRTDQRFCVGADTRQVLTIGWE